MPKTRNRNPKKTKPPTRGKKKAGSKAATPTTKSSSVKTAGSSVAASSPKRERPPLGAKPSRSNPFAIFVRPSKHAGINVPGILDDIVAPIINQIKADGVSGVGPVYEAFVTETACTCSRTTFERWLSALNLKV